MSFKKETTKEELRAEIELLQEQVITINAKLNAANRALKNHPAQIELAVLKSKWWVKLFYKSK